MRSDDNDDKLRLRIRVIGITKEDVESEDETVSMYLKKF
jgi:hypothetical protein